MNHKLQKGRILLLFDIDGTLLKVTGNHHFEAFQVSIKRHFGIDSERGTLAIAGMLDRHIITGILKISGIQIEYSDPLIDIVLKDVSAEYLKRAGEIRPTVRIMPGTTELLEQIARLDLARGLLTGNIEAIAWEKMKFSGLESYFHPFGGFGDAPVRTRGQLVPLAIENARLSTGVDFTINRTVLIGDTPKDIDAAREAGAKVIAVAGTFEKEELEKHNPDLLLDSFCQQEEFFSFLEAMPQD